jgi:acyl-CoA synthetase (AMP-forming)/AMP-acid ligase II
MFLDSLTGRLIEPLSGRQWDAITTRAEVARRVGRFARLGVRPHDRVFLHHGNRLEFFADLLAVWRLGACAVPVDTRLTPYEIGTLAGAAGPRLSVWCGDADAGAAAVLTDLGVDMVDARDGGSDRSIEAPPAAGFALDDAALILFTSGTTGNPKGVVHTHRSLRARWFALRHDLGTDCFRRTLCLLPTHFGHGLICNCLFPWLSGADLHIVPPFRAEVLAQLPDLLDAHRITFFSSVPSVWRLCLRIARPPAARTLERVFCGSAPLSAALWRDAQAWTAAPVWNAYGITETASWVAGTSMPEFPLEDGLIGTGWGAVVKVLRSAASEHGPPLDEECGPGEAGYVWLHTPALMRGYFGRDDLTRQVVSHGWFLTGDIGLVDERGWLYLRGRERDEINKGGMKVYPSDIDAALETLEAVMDVCAFGYEGDPLYGENVGVAIVLSDPSDQGLREVRRAAAQRLAPHQLPVRWYLVSEIPRTSRGKVNRRRVAEACAALEPADLRSGRASR